MIDEPDMSFSFWTLGALAAKTQAGHGHLGHFAGMLRLQVDHPKPATTT